MRLAFGSVVVVSGLSLCLACGDDSPTGGAGGGGTSAEGGGNVSAGGTGGTSDGGSPAGGSGGAGGGATCARELGPADAARAVVVGHLFASPPDYERLSLAPGGALSPTGTRFEMGKPTDHEIAFTPDGELGFAAQDDGSIGVFRIEADGSVTVLEAGLTGDYYAESVTVSTDGKTLYVVDTNFPENGGGVYAMPIGCDDTLGPAAKLVESKNAEMLIPFGDGQAILAARAAGPDSPVPSHVHRLSLPSTVDASVDAFGDDEALISWAALTRNGKHVLIGDNSAFGTGPNRVAAVEVTAAGLEARQVFTDIDDPYSIATSPFDDTAVVTSGFGDGIFVLDYDPGNAAAPFSVRGELDYATTGPQLPGALTMIKRGALDGLVLVADVRGVYQVAFQPDGGVLDLDVLSLGEENADIVTGIGAQP